MGRHFWHWAFPIIPNIPGEDGYHFTEVGEEEVERGIVLGSLGTSNWLADFGGETNSK